MPDRCERRIPTVVTTPNAGRFVAALNRPCSRDAVEVMLVTPPTPDEPQFEVAVCRKHGDEIVEREPLDEDRYTFCTDCREYAHPATGMCGCP